MSKCIYCYGDKALFRKDDQNSAFIDSKGEMLVYANGQEIRFHVDRCPMCGRRFDEKEDYLSIENGDDVWYVDYEEGFVEHGIISSVTYKEGRVYVFFVEWDDGDGDEYDGYGLGRHYFLKQANALEELRERKYEEF